MRFSCFLCHVGSFRRMRHPEGASDWTWIQEGGSTDMQVIDILPGN